MVSVSTRSDYVRSGLGIYKVVVRKLSAETN